RPRPPDGGPRRAWRTVVGTCATVLTALLGVSIAAAAPVTVRFAEGFTRGFLVLMTPDGTPIAHGELIQKPVGGRIHSRLFLNFKDGSLYDETVVFSQKGVFRVESYRLVQRGPSYPLTDVAFDRSTGRYRARTQAKKNDEEKVASGPLDMPPDLYNGMAGTLVKNLPAGAGTTGHLVAFLPEPRLVKMEIAPDGEDRAQVAGKRRAVTRYRVKFDIGGLTGVVASLMGKDPPELRYWIVPGEVPAFARFEGAMYMNGPVWRLETTPIRFDR
ncbi:MAG TPA: hypothetical protein VML54_07365, partial [Candidatus Limnocylindrales bacterium]|nr:hypothetical protein [Candidatus Limnocylindrales bacterium]